MRQDGIARRHRGLSHLRLSRHPNRRCGSTAISRRATPASRRIITARQRVAQVEHSNRSSPDSAYVVTPELAAAIAQGPTGPGKCHDVDNFILCSAKTDFGLSPVLMTPEQRVENAVANPGLEDGTTRAVVNEWRQDRVSTAHGAQRLIQPGEDRRRHRRIRTSTGLSRAQLYTFGVGFVLAGRADQRAAHYLQSQRTTCNVVAGNHLRSRMAAVVALIHRGRRGRGSHHTWRRGPGDGTVYWDDIHHFSGRDFAENDSGRHRKQAEAVPAPQPAACGKKLLLLCFRLFFCLIIFSGSTRLTARFSRNSSVPTPAEIFGCLGRDPVARAVVATQLLAHARLGPRALSAQRQQPWAFAMRRCAKCRPPIRGRAF